MSCAADSSDIALPPLFLQRLRSLVPDSKWSQVIASFVQPKRVGIRVNTLLTDMEAVSTALCRVGICFSKLSWYEAAFTISRSDRERLMALPEYTAGHLYLQNPSSMIPPIILAPKPDEEILDLAAAPGSKTSQLANMIKDRGRIAAVEPSRSRFFKLKANLAQQNIRCVRCYHADGRHVWRKVPERFDRVLLDAPCSSEARFRSDEAETFKYWSPKKIADMARLQKQLLYSGVHCLKPGGVLVYSTCSFAPEENEAVIAWALEKFNGLLELEPIETEGGTGQGGMVSWGKDVYPPSVVGASRVIPDDVYDGFFICRLRKRHMTNRL